MTDGGLTAFTLARRPDLETTVRSMSSGVLPEFMHHDAGANRYWDRLFTEFAGFQVVVLNAEDRIAASGNCVPLVWDGSVEGLPGGVGATVERGVEGLEGGRDPNVASALLARFRPVVRGGV